MVGLEPWTFRSRSQRLNHCTTLPQATVGSMIQVYNCRKEHLQLIRRSSDCVGQIKWSTTLQRTLGYSMKKNKESS